MTSFVEMYCSWCADSVEITMFDSQVVGVMDSGFQSHPPRVHPYCTMVETSELKVG